MAKRNYRARKSHSNSLQSPNNYEVITDDFKEDFIDSRNLFISADSTTADLSQEDTTIKENFSEKNERISEKGRTGFDILGDFISGNSQIRLFRLLTIELLSFILFIAWLFIQDNSNNKLDSLEGLQQFGVKLSCVVGFFVIVVLLSVILIKLEDRARKKEGK